MIKLSVDKIITNTAFHQSFRIISYIIFPFENYYEL